MRLTRILCFVFCQEKQLLIELTLLLIVDTHIQSIVTKISIRIAKSSKINKKNSTQYQQNVSNPPLRVLDF